MSEAKFHLVARASILASGATDDFHHVAPDEVVLVSVEALEQERRERDEARASATRGWEQADSLHLTVAAVADERDALKAALRDVLDNLNGYEHHPDICSRTGECDELTPDEFCSQCGDETCPVCECGLDKTQAAMRRAREALGEES